MRFKCVLTFLWCFILISNISKAQINDGINSVLWKVQYPHSSHVSYLLGTNHIFGIEWINSFSVLDSLLLTSSCFIGESIPEKKDSLILINLKKDLITEKRTAKDFFGKDFDLVNNYLLHETGVGIAVMDTSKFPKVPVLYSFLTYLIITLGEKHDLKVIKDMQLMDNALSAKAKTEKKECIGLDLDSKALVKYVFTLKSEKDINEITTEIVQLVKILSGVNTKEADVAKVLDLMKLYDKGLFNYKLNKGDHDKILQSKRNKDWMKQLPLLIKNKNCFIAVGAGHLDHKNGLLRQLSKQGFILTPISLKN